nr:translocation/assembly module TamB domain-containing protein [Lujinxingiaceae bacterium]
PHASLKLGADNVELNDFRMHYHAMQIEETPEGQRARVRARIRNVGPIAASYGLDGLSGALEMDARIGGALGFPDVELKAELRRPVLRWDEGEVTGTSAKAQISLIRGDLTIHDLHFASDAGDARLLGKIGLLDPPHPVARGESGAFIPAVRAVQAVDLQLSISDAELAPWSDLIHPQLEARGRLELQASIVGTTKKPRGKFGIHLRDGAIRGQPVVALNLAGELDEHEVRVDFLSLDADQAAQFEAKGRYGYDKSIDFELDLERFELGEVRELAALPVAISGNGNAHLRATGTLDKPEISGGLRLFGLGVGDRAIGDVALVATTADETIHLAGALLPWVSIALEVPLKKEGSYYARIGMEGLNVLQAVPELRRIAVLDDAQVTGMIEFFLESDFSHYQALAYFTDVQLESFGQNIRNRGPFIAGINNGEILQIQQATFGTGGRFVSVQGGVVFDPAMIDVRVEGDLDLGLLNSLRSGFPEFFPEVFVESKGYVMVDANLRGTPGNLVADGQLSFGPSEIVLRPLAEPLVITSGEVRFNRDGVFIAQARPLTGNALGGMLRVAGDMRFEDLKPKTLDLRMWSHNMSYRIPDMANLTFDTNLRLQAQDIARMDSWLVSGEVNVLDGLYYREINLVEKQLTGRVLGAFNRRAERYETNLLDQIPALKEIGFNLAIRARDGFKLRTQVDRMELDLEFRVDLRLRDTLEHPRVTGNIDVIDGSVSFQGETFEVRSGTVRFSDKLDNPYIDIIAGTDVRNTCRQSDGLDEISSTMSLSANVDAGLQQYYHIVLNVRGNLDNLDIHFESNPYADQRDILSMMLTGCTVDQLTASSASRPTLEIALGPLIGRLEKEIQDVVKVEEFTIMPGVERTQLRIGDTLTRRLSWRFQLDTGFAESAGGQQYQLEYKLSDNWSAELSERSRSETNSFLIDLKLKYRLPLD